MILFLLLPVVVVLLLSFVKWNFLQPPSWAGFSNFVTMTRDDHVFHALLVSAYYVLWNIPIQTVIALGLAMLLNRRLPGMGVYRALFVLPYMSTPVAMAVVWGWLFNAQNGMINHLLSLVGITGPNWLGDQATALPVVAMIATWQYAGYNMLFFLAGLQTIPLAAVRGGGHRRRVGLGPVPPDHPAAAQLHDAVRAGHRRDRVVPGVRPGVRADPGRPRLGHQRDQLPDLHDRVPELRRRLGRRPCRCCCSA